MHASGEVTDEEVRNIKKAVGVLIECVDHFVLFRLKMVTDNIQPCGNTVSWSYRPENVDPSLTLTYLF